MATAIVLSVKKAVIAGSTDEREPGYLFGRITERGEQQRLEYGFPAWNKGCRGSCRRSSRGMRRAGVLACNFAVNDVMLHFAGLAEGFQVFL